MADPVRTRKDCNRRRSTTHTPPCLRINFTSDWTVPVNSRDPIAELDSTAAAPDVSREPVAVVDSVTGCRAQPESPINGDSKGGPSSAADCPVPPTSPTSGDSKGNSGAAGASPMSSEFEYYSDSDPLPKHLSYITDWTFDTISDSEKFPSAQCKARFFQLFPRKGLTRGKGIDFSTIPECDAYNLFLKQGWVPALEINVPAYPTIVKLFYANMTFTESTDDIVITSEILGTPVLLNPARINEILKTPNCGSTCFTHGAFNGLDIAAQEVYDIFWGGKKYPMSGGVALRHMTPQHVLLAKLVSNSILSGSVTAGGHTTDLNHFLMYLLVKLVKHEQINLGYLILKYLLHSVHHDTKFLPYSMLLTYILEAEGIYLPPSWKEPPEEHKVVNLSSLNKMMLRHSDTDGWSKQCYKTRAAITSSTSAPSSSSVPLRRSARLQSASPPPAPSPSIESLTAQVHTLTQQVHSLTQQVQALSRKVDQSRSRKRGR